jgi:hypothetical protein
MPQVEDKAQTHSGPFEQAHRFACGRVHPGLPEYENVLQTDRFPFIPTTL